MAPAISVIIPVYNVAPWLRECLDSVVSQSFTDLEIIIVDDGSTDESPQIIAEYASRDKRIIAVRKQNGGLGAARNTAIPLATGDYIAFLDSDDKIRRDAYEKLYEPAKKYDCDIVYCQTAYLDDQTGNITKEPHCHCSKSSEEHIIPFLLRISSLKKSFPMIHLLSHGTRSPNAHSSKK